MIRAVIFDFNGVLVDDEMVHFDLFREVLEGQGVSLTQQQYHEVYLGYDDRGCFEAVLSDAGHQTNRAMLDAMIARKAVRYAEVAEQGLRFFPGAIELVQAMARRWPLAICSGALRPEIEFALRKMNVRDQIVAIVSAEDAERGKPDPQGYLLALEALRAQPGLADLDPAHCLVFEDSLAGIASARGAGMKAVGVAQTYTHGELDDSEADAVVPDLSSLSPAWVDQTFRDGGKNAG